MDLIPNPTTVIFEILNFLALSALLYFFVFKPMMQRIKERRAKKEELIRNLQEDREAAQERRAEWEERMEHAEAAAASIISEAQEQAEQERQAILEEAQEEVERILVEAHADAARVRRQAMREFHDELLAAILDISGMVIRQVAPDELHTSMVQQLNDRIWEMGRSEMERVEAFRRSLGDRVPTAHVRTGQPLSRELQGNLARTLGALADRNVDLDIEVDPDLVAGIRVRMGDIVIDNSIAGQMEVLEDEVSDALRERMAHEREG